MIDFRFDHACQFNEGLGLAKVGGQSGYINKSGEIAIEPQFGGESQPFFEGLAMVQAATGKCGFIDKRGRYTIEPVYDWAQPFSEGMALVRVTGKYGYITKDGEHLVEPQFDLAESYSEGYASVSKGDGWHYLDKCGRSLSARSARQMVSPRASLVFGSKAAMPCYGVTEQSFPFETELHPYLYSSSPGILTTSVRGNKVAKRSANR